MTDKIDILILEQLQQDALLTADALAERLPLSASAIARRVRRMRADGTIAADTAVVAENAGKYLSALVLVQLERHSTDAVDAVRRRLIASANVQMLLDVSGAFDLVLLIVARDMDAFNALADSLLEDDPAVRRFETSFAKRRRKFSAALPLAELLGA
ncbi:MAG: Lrp/AsnC family transcriptional regulator [Sphingomonadales bacterium]|nr:MAG: Lrp/AsnC family transcriptional regulator [Sphingomonadales bacterium]